MLWLLVIDRHWIRIFHKFRWINVVLRRFLALSGKTVEHLAYLTTNDPRLAFDPN